MSANFDVPRAFHAEGVAAGALEGSPIAYSEQVVKMIRTSRSGGCARSAGESRLSRWKCARKFRPQCRSTSSIVLPNGVNGGDKTPALQMTISSRRGGVVLIHLVANSRIEWREFKLQVSA